MPPEIKHLADSFLSSPERVEASRPATTADTVTQYLARVPSDHTAKRAAFRALLKSLDVQNAIVFCNRKRDVDILAKSMARHGFNAAPIHGDLDQSVRTATLDRFRAGTLQYLIASDVAARGLDIPMVSHVFNFDVPIHADDYVHRIGRTGRAGREGASYTLCTNPEQKFLDAILKLTVKPLVEVQIEGIDAEMLAASPSSDDRRDGRSRGGRGRGRDRGRERNHSGGERRDRTDRPAAAQSAPQPDVAAAEPVVASAVAAPAEGKPEHRREGRRDRPQKEHRPEQRSEQRGEPRERRRRHEDHDDKPVQGLGDHVPAFLLRATNVPGPKKVA